MPEAKRLIANATAKDPNLPDVHVSSGWIKLTYDWDWPGAEQEIKHALELNPNSARAPISSTATTTSLAGAPARVSASCSAPTSLILCLCSSIAIWGERITMLTVTMPLWASCGKHSSSTPPWLA